MLGLVTSAEATACNTTYVFDSTACYELITHLDVARSSWGTGDATPLRVDSNLDDSGAVSVVLNENFEHHEKITR